MPEKQRKNQKDQAVDSRALVELISESAEQTINFNGSQLRPREIGGPAGLEPTRYGDWEKNGRCSDF